ncbi:MAG TPA: tartrate-resistant acid phosphatase type 5 family protein [Acidiphilium sp.]|uniref:purple acid phosphatase family protein n=1 Tax=unclassified Acidiphilium TaxID=2617493 RepID=UPI000BD684E5|nr:MULTISPECIES: tartrate-resistant acid phosphatase type 5 family protein [unclassified Acidiphilium]OYV55386.1 MAG: acid phosphatase [Acidiphilium sp. 20-67-58]HQT61878.1 tartrate-resistant acid phosphatase type 5 family protein [Acidiphilium sp.]HQU10771.1 tartrate-resistant acid phosphatase type 5 family protein [Acidiphilium sp.]
MTISRRSFIGTGAELTAASLLAAAPAAQAAAQDAFRFLSIGDWGRNGAHHQRNVAQAMADRAASDAPRFILSLGDNFYESGVTSVTDPQWKTSFEDVYHQASLQRPWKVILGNHDYRGNVPAQLDYSAHSRRWQLPARYYTHTETLADGTAVEIFFLDTSPFIRKYVGTVTNISGQDPHAQLAWLDAALGRSKARWKIVVGHHPIYTPIGGADHDQPDLIAALEPVLRRHAVKLYINGHDHCMQYVEMGGISYVTNGVGSEIYTPGTPSRAGFVLGAHGFLTTAVTSAAIGFAFVDMDGKTRFAKTITA